MSEVEGGQDGSGAEGAPGGDGVAAEQAAASWRDSLPDDLKADGTLAKYDTVEALARSSVEMKKALGADKVVLPKGDDDTAGWDAFYKAAGRPDAADGYTFESLKEGETSALAEAFRPEAHKLGLSQRQAAGLDSFLTGFTEQAKTAELTKVNADLDTLAGEKGVTREQLDAKLDDICTKTGMDGEAAAGLVKAIGNGAAARWLLGLGEKIGEGGFVEGKAEDKFGVGSRDPEAVREEKFKDQAWVDRLNAGDPTTTAEYAKINAAIAAKRDGKLAA